MIAIFTASKDRISTEKGKPSSTETYKISKDASCFTSKALKLSVAHTAHMVFIGSLEVS